MFKSIATRIESKNQRVGGKYKEDINLKSVGIGQKMHWLLWTAMDHKKAT